MKIPIIPMDNIKRNLPSKIRTTIYWLFYAIFLKSLIIYNLNPKPIWTGESLYSSNIHFINNRQRITHNQNKKREFLSLNFRSKNIYYRSPINGELEFCWHIFPKINSNFVRMSENFKIRRTVCRTNLTVFRV